MSVHPKKYQLLNIYDNFFLCIFSYGKMNNFSCLLLAGFDSLMSSYRLSDLALLYQLFSRVKKGQDELCTAFNEYIRVIISFRLKCWLTLLVNIFFFGNERCSKINIYQPVHVLRQLQIQQMGVFIAFYFCCTIIQY